ncbi:MAG: AarF/UbiB family protein [Arsenophonus sp.]|nr:MAG: AarF/UbiB family protein [Arsenophonus sp.]
MKKKEIKRFLFIIKTICYYRLNKFIPKKKNTFLLRIICSSFFWIKKKNITNSLEKRLFLALEKLGPIWIKLGQMLSTRKDLFSKKMILNLEKLQDKVNYFDGSLAKKKIENSFGYPIEKYFDDFDQNPLASASISQIHTAKLKKNNKKIIIKIIKPNILKTIKIDINLMYLFANWFNWIYSKKKIYLKDIVSEYKKILIKELNLLNEAFNTIKLRNNFKNSNILYIPKIYLKHCRKNVIVMERIYGIPISNIKKIKEEKINLKLLAERGVKIFLIQVFYNNFFHADMHSGNIFVSKSNPNNPKYIAIDCGIIGTLTEKDKLYLAENFIAFFNRDYYKIAELNITKSLIPSNINLENFVSSIENIFDPIFKKSFKDISFGYILLNLFKIANHFNIKIQPQLFLFQKTLIYIEGLGKQIYPELNLWKTAKPFLEKWLNFEFRNQNKINTYNKNFLSWNKKIPEIPNFIYNTLKYNQYLCHSINHFSFTYVKIEKNKTKTYFFLTISVVMFFTSIFSYISALKTISIIFLILSLIFLKYAWKEIKNLTYCNNI